MKKTYPIVMIALLVTTLVACKKDKDEDHSLEKDLVGFWELSEASSSWFPVKTYDPGNGNKLKIYNDGSYAYYKDGQVTEQGNYAVVADDSVEENVCLINLKDHYKNRFDVTNVTPTPNQVTVFKTFFYIADDKLYMISGCYAVDGGSSRVYRRANPMPL
jgi:hypothetical protein